LSDKIVFLFSSDQFRNEIFIHEHKSLPKLQPKGQIGISARQSKTFFMVLFPPDSVPSVQQIGGGDGRS
jgi:hypothetical protein